MHCVSGITDDELARLYGEAKVAVVPSLYEGFSLPAVEAMACGVPLVATTGGALPEVVGTDGETGLLVPPDDPGALAAPSAGCSTTRPCAAGWAGRAGTGSSTASPGTSRRAARPPVSALLAGARCRCVRATRPGPPAGPAASGRSA